MNIQRLKEIREDRDIPQKEVATILNTTQQQYSKYELGIQLIPIDKLCELADFYNVSLDYLVGRTDERKAYTKSKYFYTKFTKNKITSCK
ncbi:MAG: helix-turn-helix transcriptional regulator [Bacilli bacterium]|nr:helix-turn-helix transcriptional regulator [Bacilli bacterium]MBQ8901838.1 helix-turn-helix transcriptional regulator [Bacilli bacterium]